MTAATSPPTHHENAPGLDLGPIMQRVRERREHTRFRPDSIVAVAVDADTDMLEACALEVARLRLANVGLRQVLEGLERSRVRAALVRELGTVTDPARAAALTADLAALDAGAPCP